MSEWRPENEDREMARPASPVVIGLLVALGLGLRLYHYLRDPSMWHDEAALVVNVLGKNFTELLGPLDFAEVAPPLFLWLEKLVSLALGEGTYALRLFPFLASCATLVLLVPLARQVLRPRAVPWALLLFACCDRLLWHTCEAKPYTVDALAAVLMAVLYCGTTSWPLTRRLALFCVLAPVVIFLVYPGCFLCGGLLVALLPAVYRGRAHTAYAVLVVAIFASFALLVFGPVHVQHGEVLSRCWEKFFPDWSRPWSVPAWSVWSAMEVVDYCCRPSGGGLALMTVVGAFSLWRRRQRAVLALLVVPFLLALFASYLRMYPFLGARVMSYAAPALVLLIAEGVPPALDWLRQRAWRTRLATRRQSDTETRRSRESPRLRVPVSLCRLSGGGLASCALAVLYVLLLLPLGRAAHRVVHPWQRPDFHAAATHVLEHFQPDDRIVTNSWESLYYFRRQSPLLNRPVHRGARLWVVIMAKWPLEQRMQLADILAPGNRTTLVHREFTDITVLLRAGAGHGEVAKVER